uniref:Uncharacterized protein n=1 Tax=Steinernema glaseri TaxID=37863 RepID=A0A1I8A2R9_9BILA
MPLPITSSTEAGYCSRRSLIRKSRSPLSPPAIQSHLLTETSLRTKIIKGNRKTAEEGGDALDGREVASPRSYLEERSPEKELPQLPDFLHGRVRVTSVLPSEVFTGGYPQARNLPVSSD